MSAKQHVGCASNGDQHHPGDTDCLVMYSALKPNAGTKATCRCQPHKDIEDVGRHRSAPRWEEDVQRIELCHSALRFSASTVRKVVCNAARSRMCLSLTCSGRTASRKAAQAERNRNRGKRAGGGASQGGGFLTHL